MTREKWNAKWKEAIEEHEELKANEPSVSQKEDWREWLGQMILSVKKLEELDAENKKLCLKEIESSKIKTLKSCANRLFGAKS